jgi:hypothetical protein
VRQDYNSTYFDVSGDVLRYRSKGKLHESFQVFHLSDGTLIGLFQGERGDRPDLDFVVKFLSPGPRKRLRTPKNLHWVVDILMIGQSDRRGGLALTEALLECYEGAKAFTNVKQRNKFQPEMSREIGRKFSRLDDEGAVSVEFVALIVELFSICEKASPRNKEMFYDLLLTLRGYFKGQKDYYQVLNATSAGFG